MEQFRDWITWEGQLNDNQFSNIKSYLQHLNLNYHLSEDSIQLTEELSTRIMIAIFIEQLGIEVLPVLVNQSEQ